MKNLLIKFTEPKVISVNPNPESGYTIVLNWGVMGTGVHRIYKKDNQFVWTDKQSPIPVRKFPSLESLMWEYELPKSLKTVLEKL
jgi:hypothetical protein